MAPIPMFSYFADLPVELRLQIWGKACLCSRVVEVQYDVNAGRFVSSCKPPSVLHVCQESRHEALKIYKVCFGSPAMPPRIYICPELDRVYFARRIVTGDLGIIHIPFTLSAGATDRPEYGEA